MAASERRQLLEELKHPDPIMERILGVRDYVAKNRSRVLLAAGGFFAALFALIGGATWYAAQGERAATSFASAVADLEFDSPSAAAASLDSIRGLANAGPYEALASLYQAGLAASDGRHEEALDGYKAFVASAPAPYLQQVGLMGQAASLEEAGRADEAAAALDQAAAIEGPYRAAALDDRARLAEAAGDRETAIASLEKYLEVAGDGEGAAGARRRLDALRR